jgi:hypothetical protein
LWRHREGRKERKGKERKGKERKGKETELDVKLTPIKCRRYEFVELYLHTLFSPHNLVLTYRGIVMIS